MLLTPSVSMFQHASRDDFFRLCPDCRAYAKHISSTEANLLEERQKVEEKLAEEVGIVVG